MSGAICTSSNINHMSQFHTMQVIQVITGNNTYVTHVPVLVNFTSTCRWGIEGTLMVASCDSVSSTPAKRSACAFFTLLVVPSPILLAKVIRFLSP
jgi:hypothetical protein